MKKVIDLHCDTIYQCEKENIGLKDNTLHISLDKRPRDIAYCQCMAIFVPDEYRGAEAEAHFGRVYQYYLRQLQLNGNSVANVLEPDKLDGALDKKPFASILAVEGGAALAGSLENVKKLYDFGVRMMTLTWNAANEIAGGCATDEGFTEFGRQAVGEMERLGMVVDVSHLSDRGFFQLCGFAERPFIASHSNSRAVCNHRRNLTDEMFMAIRDRGGIVGLNYYNDFIVEEGKSGSLDDLLRHVHHFLELGGENTLALGSDYDGAEIPPYLDSIAKVSDLFEAMEKSGIPADVVARIRYDNARRFFNEPAGLVPPQLAAVH